MDMGTACVAFLRCVCGKLAVLRAFPPGHMGVQMEGSSKAGHLSRMARRGYEQRHQSPAAMNEQAEEEDDDPKAKPWRS